MIKRGRYKAINKNLSKFTFRINTFIPNPSDSDYKRGYITRYFIQKANDTNSNIYEVSKSLYSEFTSNNLFSTVSIDWRITGDLEQIKKSNSESIRLARNIPKLSLYLPNLLQFRKK